MTNIRYVGETLSELVKFEEAISDTVVLIVLQDLFGHMEKCLFSRDPENMYYLKKDGV